MRLPRQEGAVPAKSKQQERTPAAEGKQQGGDAK
jgi:hypothetical protein